MSHELRTPLNSSLILAKLLADNPQGNLSAEQVKFAETIYSAGNDLLTLINDILDLARIESGRLDLHVGQVSLARVRESLANTFEPVAGSKRLAFSIEIAAGTPATIETDEGRLLQILRNLIANAIKFTASGAVLVHVQREGDALGFAVRDTGIGIPLEQQEVIFEAFRQADGTTSRRYGGTGLGLSISRDLSRLLGGELRVTQSAAGQGSTFTLTLPMIHRADAPVAASVVTPRVLAASGSPASSPPPALRLPPPPPVPATPPPAGSPASSKDDRDRLDSQRRSLLVIEDDPKFADILLDLAREMHFQCIVAHTADEGVRLATLHRPSGILLDVRLPDHSGMSVLERLKRRAATRHIPVHVVSATDFAQRALEMGAVGFLHKPAGRDDLIRAIRRIETRLVPTVRRLLIVEDDEVHRESLRQLLGGERIEIVTVATVAGALAALRGSTFDCVVTDLNLADGSGFDLLEQMAADAPAMKIDEDELNALLEAIYVRYHYDFRHYARASMLRRLTVALETFHDADIAALTRRLSDDPRAFASLLPYLTLQVSELFRDPSYFKSFREQIVPVLATYPSRKLWVAGCATGEEAYSLAIILKEEGLLERSLIYATDIHPESLRVAAAGVYSCERMRGFTENHRLSGARCSLSEHYTAAYDSAAFDHSLRSHIVVADHSLATDSVFAEVEVVSCRNVLIYFDTSLQERALGLFREALCRRGFLGLGPRETLRFSAHNGAFRPLVERDRWYQKRELGT